jgi:hypothetical protein
MTPQKHWLLQLVSRVVDALRNCVEVGGREVCAFIGSWDAYVEAAGSTVLVEFYGPYSVIVVTLECKRPGEPESCRIIGVDKYHV